MVKGKLRPIQAHRVGAALDGPTRAVADTQHEVMVGRDGELRALAEAWETTIRTGEGRCRVIAGPPGIGKSCLLAASLAAVAPYDTWVAQGDEYHSTTAYAPFRQLLRDVAAIAASEDPMAVAWAMRDAVSQRAPELLPWLPLVASVAGIELPQTAETAMLDEQFRKPRREQATLAVLRTMLPGPCVFAFEDVHLMDDASRDLIRRMMAEASNAPWLVLATSRDTADAPSPELCLPLEPLSTEASLAAITALTDDAPLPRHKMTDIAERAGGNPLFLTELVSAVRNDDDLVELPSSVEAIIAAQVDALPPPDRALLRAAAVLGMTVDLGVLTEMLGPEDETAPERLRDLAQFVDVIGASARFRHTLARQTAYEGLPFSRRRVLHERAATILESRAGRATSDVADVLSLHFFHAERYDAAWRYARRAGERAQAMSAHAEAAGLFARALASARHLPELRQEAELVRVALGDARYRLGDFTGARAAYSVARKGVADDPVALARLQLKIAQATDRIGALTESLRWLSRSRKLLEPVRADRTAAALRAEIGAQYALVKHFQGRERDAVRWCRQAIAEAQASGARSAEAAAALYLDVSETLLGEGDGSAARLALEIWRELGDVWQQARTHNQLGIRAYYEGGWDQALDHYRRAQETAVRAGDEWMAAIAAGNIAEILSDQGRLDEAEPLLRDALAVWRASGSASSIAFARSYLGRIAARSGRHADALDLYTQARQAFADDGEHAEVLETDARISECFVFSGDGARALAAADLAIARAADVGATAHLPMLYRCRGLALALLGDTDPAREALTESLRQGRSRNADHEVAWTLDALLSAGMGTTDGLSVADAIIERDALLARLGIVGVTRAPLAPAPLELAGIPRPRREPINLRDVEQDRPASASAT